MQKVPSEERGGWIAWIVLFLVSASLILAGSPRSVYPDYQNGSLNWLAGRMLYNGTGVDGFVYLPQAAVLFIPFALLPRMLAELLWRFLIIGIFAAGIHRFSQLVTERVQKNLFTFMSLLSIPLAWDCARNGQATLAITGLMLLAVVDVSRERWWRAAVWLAVSVALKPLSLVLVLLIMAIDRPMTVRLFVAMTVTAVLPFLSQSPSYVLQQYAAFFQNSATAAHVGVVKTGWTTPFYALRLVGVQIPEYIQTVIRAAAAMGTLVLCFIARRRFDSKTSAIHVFTLAALYLMLFSPRTENNTYAMLGPAIAVFLALANYADKHFLRTALLAVILFLMIISRPIQLFLAPYTAPTWMMPIMGILFAVYFLNRFFAQDNPEPAMCGSALKE